MVTISNKLKKKVLLDKMKKTLGNITASCEAAGIARKTYYEWLEKDPNFKAAIDAIEESCIDFAESALKKQIEEGNPTSTIFYLKTKGKKRGYVETQEITGRDGKDLIPVQQMSDAEIQAEIDRIRESRNH